MVLRYASVVFMATVLASVAALSVSAIEPREAEAADTVRTCGGGKIRLNAKEARTLKLHNQARKNRGIRRLCVHPKLTKAARAHSANMIKKDRTWHGSVRTRLERYGYRAHTSGENIAWGSGSYGSPRKVFKFWMKSSGHRSNILAKKFREIGVGVATGTYKGHKNATMYTVDFGRRR